MQASSGLGRWKGCGCPLVYCQHGSRTTGAGIDGSGEDVEIFVHRKTIDECLTSRGNVALARILYHFECEGNMRYGSRAAPGPMMDWVLVFELVSCDRNRSRMNDPVTLHPISWLQGNSGTPSVFRVTATRQRVHMYRLCPTTEGGLFEEDSAKGRRRVWRHTFRLAGNRDWLGIGTVASSMNFCTAFFRMVQCKDDHCSNAVLSEVTSEHGSSLDRMNFDSRHLRPNAMTKVLVQRIGVTLVRHCLVVPFARIGEG